MTFETAIATRVARSAADGARWRARRPARGGRHATSLVALVAMAAALFPLVAPAASASPSVTVLVDDDGTVGPAGCDGVVPAWGSIQAAVTAASAGDTVSVCPGVYDDQVSVAKDGITLQGSGMGVTVIQPTSVSANTNSLFSGAPIAAIVLVDGASGVAIRDLTVDGSAAAFNACSPGYMGIFYRASSGEVDGVRVTHVLHPSALGCQAVLGVFVQSDTGPHMDSDVAISDSVVDDYGKNGITCNEAGTTCRVSGTVVTGRGPVGLGDAAQNGIQIGFGAVGRLEGNVVTGNHYTPVSWEACGLLYYHGGGLGWAKRNVLSANEADLCNGGHAFDDVPGPGTFGQWFLFGEATVVVLGGGERAVVLSSVLGPGFFTYSGLAYVPPGTLTFAELTTLSTDFDVTDDDCGGGSPRFQVNIDTDGDGASNGNVFVYLGPLPGFTGCAPGWQASGNLIEATDARYDLSQFGGPFYGTYAGALALLGGVPVVGVQLVVDGGWVFADGEQTVLVDNVVVNGEALAASANSGLLQSSSANLGEASSVGCTSIQDGTLVSSTGEILTVGFDPYGYNYQAHLFVGTFDGSDRTLDGTYWGSTADFVDDMLIMKWSDDWLSNRDCTGDGKLDRGIPGAFGTSRGWLTNLYNGDYDSDGDGTQDAHYTGFKKIVWVGPGGSLWGEYAIILDVLNDPVTGLHGLQTMEGSPGFGLNDGWTAMS